MKYRVGLLVATAWVTAACGSAEGYGGAGELEPGVSSDNPDGLEELGELQQALGVTTQWYQLRLNARQGQATIARSIEGATFTLTSSGTAATLSVQGPSGDYWYNLANV